MYCIVDVVQDLFIKELKGYKPAPAVSWGKENQVLERHVLINHLQAAADESAVKELKLPAAPAVSAYLIEKWM